MGSARQHVSTESPYEPKLGIARAVRIGNVIAVAGTAPVGDDGRTVAPGDAATQAQRCLDIIYVALEELGADLSQVIRTRILLTDIANWESVGLVHGAFFREIRPVTTVMQVTRFIDPGWLVEIEADAIISD